MLDANHASVHVPPLWHLDLTPLRHRAKLTSKVPPGMKPTRSFSESWAWYVRGHVVSRQAQRDIVQFMAASCGKSKSREDCLGKEEEASAKIRILPANALSPERVHQILDAMAGEAAATITTSTQGTGEGDDEDDAVDDKALKQSSTIESAMRVTADLWPRNSVHWREEGVDA